MDRAAYIAMNGAQQALHQHALASQNLANSQTPGYQAWVALAESLPFPTPHNGHRSTVTPFQTAATTNAGPVLTTGREMDVALGDNQWLMVQRQDGSTGYSRFGRLQVTPGGQVLGHNGYPVLLDGGTPLVLPPHRALIFGKDGSVQIEPQEGGALETVGRLGIVAHQSEWQWGTDGVYTGESNPLDAASIQVTGQALNQSNVNPNDALLQVMDAQRRFEQSMSMVNTLHRLAQSSHALLRSGS